MSDVNQTLLAEVNELKEVCRRLNAIKLTNTGPWVRVLGRIKRRDGKRVRLHLELVWGDWPPDEQLVTWAAGQANARGQVTSPSPGERVIGASIP